MKNKGKKVSKAKKSNWLSATLKILLSLVGVIALVWSIWFHSAALSVSSEMSPHFQSDGRKLFFYLKNNNFYAAKIIKGYMAVVSYRDATNSQNRVYLFDEIDYNKEIYRDETEPIIINLKNKVSIEKFQDHVHLLIALYYRPFPFLPILKKELTALFYYNPQGTWVKQSYSINSQFFGEVFKAIRLGKKPFI